MGSGPSHPEDKGHPPAGGGSPQSPGGGVPSGGPPPRLTPRVFELAVGTYAAADVVVLGFRGKEAMSRPFRFDVDFIAPEGHDVLSDSEQIVGTVATFAFGTDARQRVVHGVVERATVLGTRVVASKKYTVGRVRIVPPLRIGRNKKTSRVYQKRAVPDVVAAVCGVDGQPLANGLTRTYAAREYCVQYDESDLEFVRRILSEEGIYWFYRYGERADGLTSEDMILGDDAATYPAQSKIPAVRLALRYIVSGGLQDTRFELAHSIAPSAARTKDYDFTRPHLDLQSLVSLGANMPAVGLAVNEWVGVLEVDRYRGDYLLPDVEDGRVAVDLDQLRRKAWVGAGESNVDRLVPGYRFEIESTETPVLAGEYVTTEVEHEGSTVEHRGTSDRVYTNRFRSIRSDLAFRPKRRKREPRQVIESAVVVGPEKGTVYTDLHGRILVQFPWDYFGNHDETVTPWLRVVQGWAGASFGVQFIPRVGMEVMVSFIGGDPDCPVVVGAVYNGANPAPFHLPHQATRSGIRTQSIPGGQGFNEISFEDLAGKEQIYLHAQRDLDEQVNRNHTQTVKKSQLVQIGDDQAISVKGNREEIVAGRANRVVGQDETVELKAGRATTIAGTDSATIQGERRVRVGSNDVVDVTGSAEWSIGDDLTVRTLGSHTTIVGKADAERSFTLHVEGTTDLYSREIMEIASPKGLRLRCGKSLVEIMPDHIDILSEKVMLRTADTRITLDQDKLDLWAKKHMLGKSDDVLVLGAKSATIKMKAELEAAGDKILLNSPEFAAEPVPIKALDPTTITVVDQDNKPLAYGRCVLVSGPKEAPTERTVALDKDGCVEVFGLESSANIVFPGNTLPRKGG